MKAKAITKRIIAAVTMAGIIISGSMTGSLPANAKAKSLSTNEMKLCQEISDKLVAFYEKNTDPAYYHNIQTALSEGRKAANEPVNDPEYKKLVDRALDEYKIDPRIHAADGLWWTLGRRTVQDKTSYYFDVFCGTWDKGFLISSSLNNHTDNVIEIMDYRNGKANGMSIRYWYNSWYTHQDGLQAGKVVDGKGTGDAEYISPDGSSGFAPIDPNESEWSWWPDWPESPSLNKKKVTLSKGKTFQLKVKGTSQKITYSSADKKIATVSKTGKITAKKAGKTKITVKIGKLKLTCTVTVR